jgi:hypothetical protein
MKKNVLQPGTRDLDVAELESISGGGIIGIGGSNVQLAGIIGTGGSAGSHASSIGVGNFELGPIDRFASTFVGNGRLASGSGVNNGLVLDQLARGSGSVVGTS